MSWGCMIPDATNPEPPPLGGGAFDKRGCVPSYSIVPSSTVGVLLVPRSIDKAGVINVLSSADPLGHKREFVNREAVPFLSGLEGE
ncbi:hypothetical protein N7490_005463 [Penicillium lividum]|nr:hypothetical protein N7490_005463 [Penicillium lividum]